MAEVLERPSLGAAEKLIFSFGAVSTGIKTRTFSAFLMVFYSQVVGMSPALVSAVIMVATFFDAFADPIIGQVSDNLRSRWGRRHPFMYVSALPTAIAFYLLWTPPSSLSHGQLLAWLVGCLLVIRVFDTFFELPSIALIPELARGYTERTRLISLRKAFEVVGGLVMVLLGYQVFMREEAGRGGITSAEGYQPYAAVCAILIFVSIVASGIATHRYIPGLAPPPPRQPTLSNQLTEMIDTLRNHAFLVMAGAGVFYAIAMGLRQTLEIYFYLYFWGFDQGQVSFLTIVSVPGSLAGVALAPYLAEQFGKRAGTIGIWVLATVVTLAPPLLRVLGLLPENGHSLIFPLIVCETLITQVLLVAGTVLVPSMIADIVEDCEVKTGRRSEGLLFAADNLFRKFVSGFGIFLSGLLLTFVAFPEKATPGEVADQVLRHLGLAYIPSYLLFIGLAITFVSFFRIDRARFEENRRCLEARARAAAG